MRDVPDRVQGNAQRWPRATTVVVEESRIDAILAPLNRSDRPGAAVGIAVNGRPVYRKAFGRASLELPVMLSPTIKMSIGSITKHFACLSFMLLCEEGKATPDAAIETYVGGLHPTIRKVTARQLMGHLSGLRDAYDIVVLFNGMRREFTAAEVLSLYRDLEDLNASPESEWSYNNGAYLLLGAIVEELAGQSLGAFMRERIFEPAGMYETVLRPFDSTLVANTAAQHIPLANGAFLRGVRVVEGNGQGGVLSTVDDMLRWLRQMECSVVGSADTWKQMRTSMQLTNGSATGYGLGLEVGQYRGVDVLAHSGGVIGANSQMLKIPAADLDVIVMVNRQDVSSTTLACQIVDACLPDLEPRISSNNVACASGIFRSVTTGRVIEFSARELQQVVVVDGTEIPCVREAIDVLVLGGPTVGITRDSIRLMGDRLNPRAVIFDHLGNVDECHRVPPLSNAEARYIHGCYASDAIRTAVSISNDGTRFEAVGPFGSAVYGLQAVARGLWRVRSVDGPTMGGMGMLSLDIKSATLSFSSGRTRKLLFRRLPQ